MLKPLILVVDDNPTLLRVFEIVLTNFGYRVCCVSGALEALETFESLEDCAAVLMDWRMPELDGLACMRRMRSIDAKRHKVTPIIAVSASALPDERSQCLRAGMDDFVAKPFKFDELRAVIANALRR